VADLSDELLVYSYHCQVKADRYTPNVPYYFHCLKQLTQGRHSEEMQMEVAKLMSEGLYDESDVADAYNALNISESADDEHILGVFRSRIADMSLMHEKELRAKLRMIGESRDSETIIHFASNSKLPFHMLRNLESKCITPLRPIHSAALS
jgi:ubiquitin carboxyl-terminal hydrolase 25